jgi:hypothetical protein
MTRFLAALQLLRGDLDRQHLRSIGDTELMQHADNPAGSRRDHGGVEEMLTRFPGPIYVATGEIINEIGVIESVEYASTDSEPWSVTVRYSRDAAKVAITTSPPAEGLQARGLPVVSVASAAMDLRLWIQDTQSRQASTDRTAASPPPPSADFPSPHESSSTNHPITVDDQSALARHIDFPDLSVVELRWAGQIVRCATTPGLIDQLQLRAGTGEELTAR